MINKEVETLRCSYHLVKDTFGETQRTDLNTNVSHISHAGESAFDLELNHEDLLLSPHRRK